MTDAEPHLSFYYRQDCHLCEDMWLHLQELRQSQPFQVTMIDVDATAELRARYGPRIPVLETGDGREICNYYMDEKGLLEYLQSWG